MYYQGGHLEHTTNYRQLNMNYPQPKAATAHVNPHVLQTRQPGIFTSITVMSSQAKDSSSASLE